MKCGRLYRATYGNWAAKHRDVERASASTHRRTAFGRRQILLFCPPSNAYRHLANGTESEYGTVRRTDGLTDDGRIAALLYAPTVGRGKLGA